MSLNRKYNHQTFEWEPMPQLHSSTFEYLKPFDEQVKLMAKARAATKLYADALDELLPPGADKTFIFRELRTIGMWANVAISRHADGTPREDQPQC